MGVHDQPQKFCKVTVHRTDSYRPWEHQQPVTRTTRSHSHATRATVTYKPTAPAPTKAELTRWTATGAAALDGLDMPSRRRAHTTATAVPMTSSGSRMDPLSRMTMRYEQEPTTASDDETEPVVMAVRTDSFLHVDTDNVDPVRQTFDEESRMFVPATPPIPSGLSVDLLPNADFTPEIPSAFKRALESQYDGSFEPASPRDSRIRISSPKNSLLESRIRISTPGKNSSLYGNMSDYHDDLPTPIMSSSVGTPLEDHSAPMTKDDLHDEDLQTKPVESSFVPSASYDEIRLSEPKPLPQPKLSIEDLEVPQLNKVEATSPQPKPKPHTEDEEELFDDEAVSSFVEVDSDNEDAEDMDVDDSAFDVCDNFDAILGEPLPNRGSRWRFSIGPKKSFVRSKRGMSSPPRMVSAPPPALARHMSVPAAFTPPHQTGESIRPKPIVHAPAGTPLYHGQMLHLVFKASDGHTVQVSTQQRRSKSSVFSKLIDCFSTESEPFAAPEDALRIIAHTSEGDIRGGDRISLARGDGAVLRIQKMSKKLSFSPKIDMKAKFVVCGVPEGTVVTDTTKFYLQSVYDRTKTVGFLKGRHAGTGCLVLYQYRTTDDKSEPIQFFKRAEPPSFAQMHAAQQGHALGTSPVMGGFM